MKKSAILAAAAALSLVLGTSVLAQEVQPAGSEPSAAPVAEAAPAPSEPVAEAAAASPAAASAGKGKIVFFRPSRLSGAVYTYHIVEVSDDGKPAKDAPRLGNLKNGGAFEMQAEPGIHSFNITGPMAVNKSDDRLRMEVEPGETYYVEQTVRIGLVTGGFRLVPADEARFTASKVKFKGN